MHLPATSFIRAVSIVPCCCCCCVCCVKSIPCQTTPTGVNGFRIVHNYIGRKGCTIVAQMRTRTVYGAPIYLSLNRRSGIQTHSATLKDFFKFWNSFHRDCFYVKLWPHTFCSSSYRSLKIDYLDFSGKPRDVVRFA